MNYLDLVIFLGNVKIRSADNVLCKIVFEDDVGYAREIYVLPFTVDTSLIAKCIPCFIGTVIQFDLTKLTGVIENADGATADFSLNDVSFDGDSAEKIANGYSGEVVFSVWFARGVYTAKEVRCLRGEEE